MKIKMLIAIAGVSIMLSACSTTEVAMVQEETVSDTELYRVKDGDNLMLIAERVYGTRAEWVTIYEANEDVITDPTLIYPGQVIELPLVE